MITSLFTLVRIAFRNLFTSFINVIIGLLILVGTMLVVVGGDGSVNEVANGMPVPVFAHELGHVVHRHMWWYLLFMAILMMFAAGPLAVVLRMIPSLDPRTAGDAAEAWAWRDQITIAPSADDPPPSPPPGPSPPAGSPVAV